MIQAMTFRSLLEEIARNITSTNPIPSNIIKTNEYMIVSTFLFKNTIFSPLHYI